jgi:hypothetical protein
VGFTWKCDECKAKQAPHCGMCQATGWRSCMRAWICCVSSHVCGQQREGGGELGFGALFFGWCAREGRNVTHPCFLHAVPSSQPSHTVLDTNPHTLPHHALQTLNTHQHTHATTKGERGDGGLVVGSATTMRHRFPRQTRTQLSGGCVHFYIQSPKHLESMVAEFPHHQA